MKKAAFSLLIAFSLVLFSVFQSLPAAALNNTDDNLTSAGFTSLEKESYDAIYTPLAIPGFDFPVFAFQSSQGTEFRLYGRISKQTGYFPASVEVADAGTENERFVISILEPVPAKGDKKSLAKLTTAPYSELPEGFEPIGKSDCAVFMVNIYGNTETYIYGTYDDPASPSAVYGWFASRKAKAVPGAMKVDLSDAPFRKKPDDVKKQPMPKEIRKGFAQSVEIRCTNGFTVNVSTCYQRINYEELKEKIRHLQETKTGTFTEYVDEEIPFKTEITENRNRYSAEKDIVLQEGVPGLRRTAWKVTYRNGTETGRRKSGTKVLSSPVSRIIDRGTLNQTEQYVFSDHARITISADRGILPEKAAITAKASIAFSGAPPEGAYSCRLSIINSRDEVVASSTEQFPSSVTFPDAPAGTYTVRASAIQNGSEARTSTTVKVASGISAKTIPDPVSITETVTETVPLDFDTEYTDDDTLFADEPEQVTREGVQGKKVITWLVTLQGGEEKSREKLSETVSVEPLNRIIRRGTRQHTTETRTETTTDPIPTETETIDDPSRFTDDPQEVIREGSTGEKSMTWNVTYRDGIEVSRSLISESITRAMETRQISRGTRSHTITYGEISITEPIPYNTVREAWNTLEVGEEITAVTGSDGEKQVIYRITYTDGQETARQAVSETVIRQPVDEYIAYGTFEPSYSYEYVSIGLPGAHGQNSLSGEASAHAMAMAKSHKVFHAGSGYTESVGGWDSAGAVGSGLMGHVPGLAACEVYGVGCVRCTKTLPDGSTRETYYGAAFGGGGILLDENGEIWY